MESMGILGFIFGMSGLSFALIAKEQLSTLRKEFDEMKKKLEESGALHKES